MIHSWAVSPERDRVEAGLEWTFPMVFVEVIWGEGAEVKRQRVALNTTRELVDKVQHFS